MLSTCRPSGCLGRDLSPVGTHPPPPSPRPPDDEAVQQGSLQSSTDQCQTSSLITLTRTTPQDVMPMHMGMCPRSHHRTHTHTHSLRYLKDKKKVLKATHPPPLLLKVTPLSSIPSITCNVPLFLHYNPQNTHMKKIELVMVQESWRPTWKLAQCRVIKKQQKYMKTH